MILNRVSYMVYHGAADGVLIYVNHRHHAYYMVMRVGGGLFCGTYVIIIILLSHIIAAVI